jgi:hypothetical protein
LRFIAMEAGMSSGPVSRSTVDDVVMFIALLATALAMAAGLAHALELPNKITLARDEYFIVQNIYRGWDRLAYLLAVELAAMLVVAVRARRTPRVFVPAITAIACLVAAQAIFWIWTFPANAATTNWTTIPDGWEALRVQWEYSHLAGAGFQVLALCALIMAALARARGGE